MKKLVIFDLDGTLINTIADLAGSTNYALEQCGFPTHAADEYNYFVGNGIDKLFERALPEGEKSAENVSKIRKEFLRHYNIHNADYSTPYPGIPELLSELQARGILLAVASNKYQAATQKLIEHFFPEIQFVTILGQRENIPVKPNPAIVNEIIALAGISREEVLYVGDSGVDIQTSKNANVTGTGVTWGFRPQRELEEFNPDFIVTAPQEILNLL